MKIQKYEYLNTNLVIFKTKLIGYLNLEKHVTGKN